MAEEGRSYYQLLGVRPDADLEQVRDAFHSLAKSLHPDARAGAPAAEAQLADRRMREINQAWTVLRDPDQRASYDEQLAHERERAELIATARAAPVDPRVIQHEVHLGGHDTSRHADDADGYVLSGPAAFLMRRGPVLALVAVAAGLLIGSAYADRRPDPDERPTTTVTDPTSGSGDSQAGS